VRDQRNDWRRDVFVSHGNGLEDDEMVFLRCASKSRCGQRWWTSRLVDCLDYSIHFLDKFASHFYSQQKSQHYLYHVSSNLCVPVCLSFSFAITHDQLPGTHPDAGQCLMYCAIYICRYEFQPTIEPSPLVLSFQSILGSSKNLTHVHILENNASCCGLVLDTVCYLHLKIRSSTYSKAVTSCPLVSKRLGNSNNFTHVRVCEYNAPCCRPMLDAVCYLYLKIRVPT